MTGINELREKITIKGLDVVADTDILAVLDRLEVAEKERDALRSLVVMRFDLDHPPQFTQGYDTHELTEPVTAEHCRWFVAEIERLRAKIEAMEQQEPFDADSPEFRRAFDAALKTGHWPLERKNFGYRSPMSQMAWQVAFCTVNNLKLYALPGAKGE